jgi:hypothetical protein
MSAPGWQDLIVLIIVLATAAWLVRRAIIRRRHKSCGCDDCPAKKNLLKARPRPR